jgi:hypothetical protein
MLLRDFLAVSKKITRQISRLNNVTENKTLLPQQKGRENECAPVLLRKVLITLYSKIAGGGLQLQNGILSLSRLGKNARYDRQYRGRWLFLAIPF